MAPWWPLLTAAVLRLGIWHALPARFASDEDSYFAAATRLLTTGEQDLFWPPFTPWLIAAVRWLTGSDQIQWVRLAWIVMDLACVLAVWVLSRRIGSAVAGGLTPFARRLAGWVTLAYALYLPAISFSQFATSETPALLQVLLMLCLLTAAAPRPWQYAAAGLVGATLTLTRPSLLPLTVALPAALFVASSASRARTGAVVMMATAQLGIGGYLFWNFQRTGEVTLGRNSAYNLYIGNREMYGEDLNLFQPRATPAQVEFRRQMWSGTLEYPTQTAAELQREALHAIASHPGRFIRRAIGRLARVFAPRTDVLELAGGEMRAGVFAPLPLSLLIVANLQWTVVLFGGGLGLMLLWRRDRMWGALSAATVAGSVVLCLVAISKPRYSFVFDPLLIAGAALFLTHRAEAWRDLSTSARLAAGLVGAFLLWGWTAWAIFSFTSRLSP